MRYTYTITDNEGKEEEVKAMSWKKMLKSLLLKTPKFTGKIAYINKKKHKLIKFIKDGRIVWSI
mgnify:CR=1 FL=1